MLTSFPLKLRIRHGEGSGRAVGLLRLPGRALEAHPDDQCHRVHLRHGALAMQAPTLLFFLRGADGPPVVGPPPAALRAPSATTTTSPMTRFSFDITHLPRSHLGSFYPNSVPKENGGTSTGDMREMVNSGHRPMPAPGGLNNIAQARVFGAPAQLPAYLAAVGP